MVDLNNPEIWNVLVSLVGGAAIAAGARVFVPYIGRWYYTSRRGNRDIQLVKRISAGIREPITKLEDVNIEHGTIDYGDKIDAHALIQSRLAERAGLQKDPFIFREEFDTPKPSIDYVVCFSNVETQKDYNVKILAASIASELKRQGKKVHAYAIGSDLVEIEDSKPQAILNIPSQSGFNLFRCLDAIYRLSFNNPSYVFFLIDASASVTDERQEKTALQRALSHTNVVQAFIEIGKPRPPYTISKLADSLNAQYASIVGNHNTFFTALPDVFYESARKMKEVAR